MNLLVTIKRKKGKQDIKEKAIEIKNVLIHRCEEELRTIIRLCSTSSC